MASLFDYLDWRGDLTLEEAEFNEVDNLILSWLSYAAFDGIVPEECSETNTITIQKANEIFLRTHDVEKIQKEMVSFTKSCVTLLQKLAQTKRFQELRLTGFVNQIDYKKEAQFSAITVLLKKNLFYVVFRGTDETLIGWKEDFNMSFLPVVPSQSMALDYLEKTASKLKGNFYIGGHSKGGNLAVYAGVRAGEKVRSRILTIYNNDGPGFMDIKGLGNAYEEMLPKIQTYVPESAVVGMLLEHMNPCVIVKSSQKGLFQHDATSWEVLGKHFITVEQISDSSRVLSDVLKKWLGEITTQERELFIDTLYGILETTQAKNLDDLNAEKGKIANVVLKELNGLDKEIRTMLGKTISSLFKEGNQAILSSFNLNTERHEETGKRTSNIRFLSNQKKTK